MVRKFISLYFYASGFSIAKKKENVLVVYMWKRISGMYEWHYVAIKILKQIYFYYNESSINDLFFKNSWIFYIDKLKNISTVFAEKPV